MLVKQCEVVSPALETEIKNEVKSEVKSGEVGIILKPKQEMVSKSASQIVHEQNGK